MKICIFPNDPIISYFEKGEIKNRYFNPENFFDEVHIISFIDNDIDEKKVQVIAGDATLKIHSMGKIEIKKRKDFVDNIIQVVKSIKPDVIRAYNSRLEENILMLRKYFLSIYNIEDLREIRDQHSSGIANYL